MRRRRLASRLELCYHHFVYKGICRISLVLAEHRYCLADGGIVVRGCEYCTHRYIEPPFGHTRHLRNATGVEAM